MRWLAWLVLIGMLPLAACESYERETGICPVAPPMKAEEQPKPPVSEDEQLWQPGHWDWDGRTYAWRPGVWILRAGGNLWMDGHWTRDQIPAPCAWVPSHWVD